MTGAVDHVGLHARLSPRRLAAADLTHGGRWTYAQLDDAIARCASALVARGVGVGDRVAALARNRVELVVVHLACARIGAIYAPLNWRLSGGEIEALIEDAEPSLFVADSSAPEGLAHTPLAALIREMDASAPLPVRPINAERPSLILYTSGTSGRPKGVIHSERTLAATAANFSLLGQVTHNSVLLCDAPMFHVIGLVSNVRPTLMRGGACLVSDGFVPARTLDRLADPALGVTHYFCVPQMASALRAEPGFDPARLSALTAIFTGGAPHPAESIRAWLRDGIALVDGFGMSEAGTVFGMPLDPALIAERAGSAGIAPPGVETRIVDANGENCGPGEAGELLLKGANISSGYWRRPQETADAFTADGWFRTGDIVRADAQGYHWLVDRRKDMFISGGENVYPAEIEALLAGHPDIAECAVVGTPDAKWGEVGHLFIVGRPGVTLDSAAILAALEARLARYKHPRHVTILVALPRNGAGKVLKTELRRLLPAQP
jgi:fatty-acyl-CoA synthase